MKLIIEGDEKEIAALIFAVSERQIDERKRQEAFMQGLELLNQDAIHRHQMQECDERQGTGLGNETPDLAPR